MNKFDLIEMMAEGSHVSKRTAECAYQIIIDQITDTLKKGGKVQFKNFGSFRVAQRAASTRFHYQTGQEINISAANIVKFRPGKRLAEAANESKTPPKRLMPEWSGFFKK